MGVQSVLSSLAYVAFVAGRPVRDTVSEGTVSVKTTFGTINGESISKGFLKPQKCENFLGIPYAQAPTGMLRWAPTAPWNETYPSGSLDAGKYSAICPQAYLQKVLGTEDCLFLNIWRPAGTTESSALPIMIWIHGGAFVMGSGNDAVYDGCSFASNQGVIIATLNYRLGPLGFATFKNADHEVQANFGIQDQREAIRWIRQQAHAFGGDADKVTIFGESAGGISVIHHMVSPLSKGLFRAAIAESAIPSAVSAEFSMENTLKLADNVKCERGDSFPLDCMTTKSAAEIILNADEAANPFTSAGWSPAIDGIDMPDFPLRLVASGKVNPATLLAGTNTDEANFFVYPYHWGSMDERTYRMIITKALNSHDPQMVFNSQQLDRVFAEYPPSSNGDNRALAGSLLTDATFLCQTEIVGQQFPSSQSFFQYRFNHRAACLFEDPIPGVHHALEVPFVFGTAKSEYCVLTPRESELSDRIQKYWGGLGKNLDPGFPRYTNASRQSIALQTPEDAPIMNYRGDKCKFWHDIYAELLPPHSAQLPVHDASPVFV